MILRCPFPTNLKSSETQASKVSPCRMVTGCGWFWDGMPRQGRRRITGWPAVEKSRAQRTLEKDPQRPTTL
eukprot:12377331-Alexandrium_andersonii.AAC.1